MKSLVDFHFFLNKKVLGSCPNSSSSITATTSFWLTFFRFLCFFRSPFLSLFSCVLLHLLSSWRGLLFPLSLKPRVRRNKKEECLPSATFVEVQRRRSTYWARYEFRTHTLSSNDLVKVLVSAIARLNLDQFSFLKASGN